MKANFTSLILLVGMFSLISIVNSCTKPDNSANLPKEQQVVGQWFIGRVQLRIYVNGVFIKDTIVKPTPKPLNFVRFDADGGFEYRYNTNKSDIGTYEFGSASKLITNSSPKTYIWTMLTLTKSLFTVVSKDPDPEYPGALVERYQTFERF